LAYNSQILDHEGRREEALRRYDRAIALSCDSLFPYERKSIILLSRGDIAGALQALQEGEQILLHSNPSHFERARFHLTYGQIAKKDGDYHLALMHFTNALDMANGASDAKVC